MDLIIEKKNNLKGEITIPSDKSISHRAIMFSALAKGKTLVKNFSKGADCHSTLKVFSELGIEHNFLDEQKSLMIHFRFEKYVVREKIQLIFKYIRIEAYC